MHQDDEELEVRMMFLEEAIGYIESIEDGLADLDPHASSFRSQIDGVLRAAHSLKGGAAMMQFEALSHAAHLLEDSLKIVKENRPEIDFEIEGFLFNSSEILRQIVRQYKSQQFVDLEWLETQVFPLFEKLETRLHDAAPAEGVQEEEEEEVNLVAIMFESEVESYLEQLEGLVTDPETSPTLDADILEIAGDLAAMGEMLELSNFVALCQSVIQALVAKSHPPIEVATVALSAWRNAQALVMIGNVDAIATRISLPPLEEKLEEKEVPNLATNLATTEELLTELEEALEITDAGLLVDTAELVASNPELPIESNKPQLEPDIREMFDDLESYLNLENEPRLDGIIPSSNLNLANELNLEDDLTLDRKLNPDEGLELENRLDSLNSLDQESELDLDLALNLENNLNLDEELDEDLRLGGSSTLDDILNPQNSLESESSLDRQEDVGFDNELNPVEESNLDKELKELGLESQLEQPNELSLEDRFDLQLETKSSDRLNLDTDLNLEDVLELASETQFGDDDLELVNKLEPSPNLEDEINSGDSLSPIGELAENLDLENELTEFTEDDLNVDAGDWIENDLELENELEINPDLEDELAPEDNLDLENLSLEDELEISQSIDEELNLGDRPRSESELEGDRDVANEFSSQGNLDLNLESELVSNVDIKDELNPEDSNLDLENELDAILGAEENDLAFVKDPDLEEETSNTRLEAEEAEAEIAEEEEPVDEEERAVRMMFLEEASEYIDSIDDGLTDFDTSAGNFKQQIDRVLRSAHSLKGGAAMMQFDALSRAAHRLEDSFKVLKENRPAITSEIEGLLFNSAEILRQIVREYKQGARVTSGWLENNAFPIFEALEAQLNAAEATEPVEEEEEEVSLVAMMFESEVENYLDRLEGAIADSDPTLYTELTAIAEDLASIGEMLELPNFVSLCQSVTQALADRSRPVSRIAESALAAWRNAQALVTIGNTEAIATQITLPPLAEEELSEILEEVYAELSEDTPALEIADLEITDSFLADANELTERLADLDEVPVAADVTETETVIKTLAKNIEAEVDLNLDQADSIMEAIEDLNLDEVDSLMETIGLEHADEVDSAAETIELKHTAESDENIFPAEEPVDTEELLDDEVDDEERAVRLMFLEEASEYIDSIDDGLADFDPSSGNFKQRIDQVLRAVHSLKGGAAMMQFNALSRAAHRLEDSFKILKENRPAITAEIEGLLFNSAEILHQIVREYKQGTKVTAGWLENNAFPTFEALELQLNAAEATEPVEEEEEAVNLAAMMFESEVEVYLDLLETMIANPDPSSMLDAELASISEDLSGIGEMLELPNFVSLCQSVTQALVSQSHPTLQIAEAALAGWRNAQALATIGNTSAIAKQISLPARVEETYITDTVPLADLMEPEQFEDLPPQDITVGEFATDIDEFATELEAVSVDSALDSEIAGKAALTDAEELGVDLDALALDIDNIDADELERSQVTDSFADLDVFTLEPDELEDDLEDELLIFEPERPDTPFQDRALEAFIFESIFDVDDGIELFGSSSSTISTANKNNKRGGNAQTAARGNNPLKRADRLPESRDRASTATLTKPVDRSPQPSSQPGSESIDKSVDIEQPQSKPLPVGGNANSLLPLTSPTEETSSPQVDAIDDSEIALPDDLVSPVIPKEGYPQTETLGDFLSDSSDAITSASQEESSHKIPTLVDAMPVTPMPTKESSSTAVTLDDIAIAPIDDVIPVTTSKKGDEDKNPARETNSSSTGSSVKARSSSKAATKDKQDKARKFSSDMPALKTSKGKDFSAYLKPEKEKTPDKAQKTVKSQDAAGSLFELFEDLDTSQESNDLPTSLPQSISDLVSAYLKEASIRLPVSRLEQMYDISEELSIGNNGVDRQLRRMRSLVKILDGRMRDLENTNLQLQSTYDRMTLQNSLGLTLSELQANEEDGEYNDTNASRSVALTATASETSAYADFDNLEMDRYGELHSLSQSVIETIVQLEEAIADVHLTLAEAEQNASNQNRHFKQLQTAIAQIRMRPISDIVSKFPRVIRSLSMQHGKDVDLVIEGGETLIDRVILDALSDPLNHILRNAFDHGIEVTSVRAERGKPAQGKILIKALFQGDKILVIVQDDGGGIDAEKIRNKVRKMAIESGKDTSQIDAIPRQKLLSLIFEPGFSTADKVTSLSGRGVGMDVVQTNLNQIGAKISIDTEVGVGTTFTISIPFTLLSTRVLLVQVAQTILAIPSSAIAAVVACSSTDIFKQDSRYGFVWQEQTLPVVQLGDRLKLNCQHQIDYIDDRIVTSGSAMIIVEINNELAAILADAFWSEQEATIRQIEGNIRLPKLFSGCIILGSGQAVPLLDLNEVALQFHTGLELLIPPTPELPTATPVESPEPENLDQSPELIESSELIESLESTDLSESTELIESPDPSLSPTLVSSPSSLDFSGRTDSDRTSAGASPLQIESPEYPTSPTLTSSSSALDLSGGTDSRAGMGAPPLQLGSQSPNLQPPRPKTRASILVVDDSINVRRFLALTLEKAGFRVEQAKDGEEALAKIVDGLNVNAVVSDVEMPRLDGYGLLSQIRAKPEHSKLPVVMLTSRSGDKHRRLAMNLGATGYFTKPYQERELINTLRELTQAQGSEI